MFKLIVIGNQHVGKTSIINKYVRNVFQRYQAETSTYDFQEMTEFIQSSAITGQKNKTDFVVELNMQIWDTVG